MPMKTADNSVNTYACTRTMMISSADISAVATTYQWNQASKTWQLLQQSGGADGYRIGKNLSTPHSDEVTASIRREVQRGSMASARARSSGTWAPSCATGSWRSGRWT